MKKIIILSIILLMFILKTYSQILPYSNEFLNIGISARNISLGNSVAAGVDDYSSGYYNAAGLSCLKNKYEVSILHSEYFAGITKYDFGGFSYRINNNSGIAFSVIRLGVDNIQNTLYLYDENGNIDYDRIKYFSVSDYSLMFSYGKKTSIQGLSYGLNSKLIYRNQGVFAKGYGFGIDASIKYKIKKLIIGANLVNATTTFTGWFNKIDEQMEKVFEATNNDLPSNSLEITMPVLKSGINRYFKLSDKTGLDAEFDLNLTFDGKRNALLSFKPVSFYPQTGLEFNYKHTLYIRSGVNNFQLIPDFRRKTEEGENYYREKSLDFIPSAGLGIVFKGFYLDYAITDIANQSVALYSHIFSISYKF